MLNDKSRHGLSHLPAARKWHAFTAGQAIRLPASRICGGWGPGWYDWYPWTIESFDLRAEFATLRSLTDRRLLKTISRRELEFFDEHRPFGTLLRSHNPPEIAQRGFRYVRAGSMVVDGRRRRILSMKPTTKNPRYV